MARKSILFVLHLLDEINNGATNEAVFGCFIQKVIIPKCSGQLTWTCAQKIKETLLAGYELSFWSNHIWCKRRIGLSLQ